jgi:hypothetical protein
MTDSIKDMAAKVAGDLDAARPALVYPDAVKLKRITDTIAEALLAARNIGLQEA